MVQRRKQQQVAGKGKSLLRRRTQERRPPRRGKKESGRTRTVLPKATLILRMRCKSICGAPPLLLMILITAFCSTETRLV
jgi:hypothetical protein